MACRALAARRTQVRYRHGGSRWPREFSRKKWHLGPPPLPPEIVDWMQDLEEQKQEKLEAQRDDILPPGPRFQGSSHIPVTFLPRIRGLHDENDEDSRDRVSLGGNHSISGSLSSDSSVRVGSDDHTPELPSWQDGYASGTERCSQERMDEYIAYYRKLAKQGVVPSETMGVKMGFQEYSYMLLQCADERTLARGKWAHAHLLSHGFGRNRYLSNYLMIMYSKCGSLRDAEMVFDDVVRRNVYSYTILIRAYADEGLFEGALLLFRKMLLELEDKPNETTMSCVLTACGKIGFRECRRVHQLIENTRMVSTATVGNALVSAYSRCGAVEEAREAFERIEDKNLVSWNAMIAAFCRLGHYKEALGSFAKMEREGFEADIVTYMCVLEAIQGEEQLELGKAVEERMVRNLSPSMDVAADTALLNMYARCGSLGDARRVFDEMPLRDMVAWSAMLGALTQNGRPQEAIWTFKRMMQEGMKANWITLVSLVEACSSLGDLEQARKVEEWIAYDTELQKKVLQNALLGFFGKHGKTEELKQVFEGIAEKDGSSWNAMMSALGEQGCSQGAIELLKQMLLEGVEADRVTFLAALEACSVLQDLATGKQIHSMIRESRTVADDHQIQNTVVSMYGKCGSVRDAAAAFESVADKGIVTWNAMFSAFAETQRQQQHFHQQEMRVLRSRMDVEGVKPDKVTLIQLLECCCCLEDGRAVHERAREVGLVGNVMLDTALVDMYGRLGSLEEAKEVFAGMEVRDPICWAAMLGALVENGDGESAVQALRRMDFEGAKPNGASLVRVLEACESLNALETGKMVYERALSGSDADQVVVETAAVSLLASCGQVGKAMQVFEAMEVKTRRKRPLVAWNKMMGVLGHGDRDRSRAAEAVKLFARMEQEGVKGDGATLAALLDAVGSLGDRGMASRVLERVESCGVERDAVVEAMAISMLARCGDVESARMVMERWRRQGDSSLSLMATAYAQSGRGREAVELLWEVEKEGLKPSPQLFAAVLCACSHAGMLEDGCKSYYAMTVDHGMEAKQRQKNVVVDLLARAGWLNEAEVFFDVHAQVKDGFSDEVKEDDNGGEVQGVVAWSTLLGCSGTHGDVELARRAAARVSELDPAKPATYVALSNMYAWGNLNSDSGPRV